MPRLAVNTMLQYGGDPKQIERILWIDAWRVQCYTINIFDNRFPKLRLMQDIEQGLQEETCRIVDDEWFSLVCEEFLSEKARVQMENAWEAVKQLVDQEPAIFDTVTRMKLIQKASEFSGISTKTIGRYLKSFWMKGKVKYALAPGFDKRGGSGKTKASGQAKRGRPRKYSQDKGINVDEEVERIFRVALKKYYYTSKKAPLKFAYQKMIQEFYSQENKIENGVKIPIIQDPDELPTYAQFKYFFQKENSIKKEVSTRFSSKKYELLHRPVIGSATAEAIGPGSRYLLDGTTFDMYLVSRINRNWIIGRPCLYYVQDVFSRVVVGVFVGLETSWLSAAMAIANCCEDKVEFCKQYGIDIRPEEWEAKHLPETILGDRGELFTQDAETLISSLHVKIENTSSYRGDLKAILERHFRTTNDLTKMMLPGVIDADFRQRGPSSRDYRLDAKLDLYQFNQVIIRCVLYHNNHYLPNYPREEMMISDDIESIPSKIWQWGVQYRSGKLREVPKSVVLLNLLPVSECLVTYQGLKFKGLFYSSHTALKERWMEKARTGTWKLSVSYDPRNLGTIYLRGVGENGFEPCYLLSQYNQYNGRTQEEIEYLQEFERMQKAQQAKKELQPQIDLITHIEAIVLEAEKQTKEKHVPGTKAERLRGIQDHRNLEKQLMRNEESMHAQLGFGKPIHSEDKADSAGSIDYFNDFDLLKKKRGEK
ncbi:Mu transposase C-terminal domain-containing protein [Paenibacillus polymyxa]|uniref:Mu transposase C-terminal domain-containing protein n=1 Tax=Paenibacillus polymyxa TaxID=1406 RepID=UPI0023793F62|nr:Mu transposase C-terminal domain-containing protein [Paenibacillus polymyxa]WDM21266.1 DDE-type integrase/transposase/recombinase [Paenibacillus polymyxa]